METLLDTLVVAVKADTRGIGRDFKRIEQDLSTLGAAGDAAARRMTRAFETFLRTGEFGFKDLRRTALAVLNDIAARTFRESIGGLFGRGGGLFNIFGSILGGGPSPILSLAGRAGGGAVDSNRAFLVGERGPEIFLPNSAGRIQPASASAPRRERPLTININVAGAQDACRMRQSAGQVAAAVRRAVMRAERDL